MTDSPHISLADKVEALEGLLAAEAGRTLIDEARRLIHPTPPVRVSRQPNGEPWGGDGLGPYTEEYKKWSKANQRFLAYKTAGAFLEIAVELVPRPWLADFVLETLDDGRWLCRVGDGEDQEVYGKAATSALAITAAALKAHDAVAEAVAHPAKATAEACRERAEEKTHLLREVIKKRISGRATERPRSIADIAEGLDLLECEWITGWQGVAGAAFNVVATGLCRKGLLVGYNNWSLNETGLAVKDYLTREDND